MKVIIDECLPKRLNQLFSGHEVWTVPQIGLAGFNDKELLNELDKRNIEYQQSLSGRRFSTIIIHSLTNRLTDLLLLGDELNNAVNKVSSASIIHVPKL